MATVSVPRQLHQLKKKFGLGLELDQKISDEHIQEFSSCHGSKWRLMPAHLSLLTIIAEDIDRAPKSEDEKRHAFFTTWKEIQGDCATYKALITALLKLHRRGDAEAVCKLLRYEEKMVPEAASLKPEALLDTPSIDPVIYKSLEHRLHQNWEEIQKQYASFVSCLCNRVKQTKVTPDELQLYLINLPTFTSDNKKVCRLFAHARDELKKADTITAIFFVLSEKCTSFLNCDIFFSLMSHFRIPIDCEELDYLTRLEKYIHKHTISEFLQINPKLQEHTKGSEKFKIKLDVKKTSKLSKLLDLQDRIAAILKVDPAALRLLSMEEGCLVVTFLISTELACAIFTAEKEFAAEEIQEFQALFVLWLECNHHKFVFETGREDKEETKEAEVVKIAKDHTAVHMAVGGGNSEIIKCPIETFPDTRDHEDQDGNPTLLELSNQGVQASTGSAGDECSSSVEGIEPEGKTWLQRVQSSVPKFFGQFRLKNIIIMRAAKSGDHSKVLKLLMDGADPNTKEIDAIQWTPLMWASHRGHTETVKILLQHGGNPNLGATNGFTALILASRKGHHEVVRLLLDRSNPHPADVNATNDTRGWSALMWASQTYAGVFGTNRDLVTETAVKNRKIVAELLLKAGADVNLQAKVLQYELAFVKLTSII